MENDMDTGIIYGFRVDAKNHAVSGWMLSILHGPNFLISWELAYSSITVMQDSFY